MEQARDRLAARPQNVTAIAIFAGAVGVLSILWNLDGAGEGEIVAYARIALALLGIAGAVLAWLRRGGTLAWTLLLVWAVVQIPVIAWSAAGSPTEQLVRFPLTVSSSRTVNGVVTDYSEYGINLIGVGLTIALVKLRSSFLEGAAVTESTPSR